MVLLEGEGMRRPDEEVWAASQEQEEEEQEEEEQDDWSSQGWDSRETRLARCSVSTWKFHNKSLKSNNYKKNCFILYILHEKHAERLH